MIVPGSANALMLGQSQGYNLTKSLRFRSSASAYLTRTFGANPTDGKKLTISVWIKRGLLASGVDAREIMTGYDGSSTRGGQLVFGDSSDILVFEIGGGALYRVVTNQVFRDPSAWYHIVAVVDTTQATDSNRIKLYVNGVQITSFSTTAYPPQNNTTQFLLNGGYNKIGTTYNAGAAFFDGYMAEMNVIDGQALTPSSFGSTNATTGVWQPAKYTGTYGTNGFYLPFTNTTSTTTLGYDFSGNSNNWTTNNFSLTAGYTYDSMTDVPTLTSATTANYPVINPLDTYNGGSITNGNLLWTTTGTNAVGRATMAFPTTGKYYFEAIDVVSGGNNAVGLANRALPTDASLYSSTGAFYTSMFSNATYGFALNFDSLTYTIYKNNSVESTGSLTSGITYGVFMTTSASGGASTALNFGQQGFTYTPPTGYVALNTYNLPTSTIVQGNKYMDATTFTGNASTNVITNAGSFKPDMVWLKSRSNANNHTLYDSVRGVNTLLYPNLTNAEATGTNQLTAFNSNGFTVGASENSNDNVGESSVGWQWQAGQGTTSSNTNGSITSTVSVNASAGFSVFTFNSGSSGTQTVGHGLGVYPGMIIFKDRSGGYWNVWHSAFSNPAQGYMYLDLTNAVANDASQWSNTAPTSSVFTYNSGYAWSANHNMVAYAWAPIAGFSKFGSYTGNGSADGPFVYTGFRPKFVMIKNSSVGSTNWFMYDSSRNTYNVVQNLLLPNASAAEYSGYPEFYLDFLSNGFKIKSTDSQFNGNGNTLIYMAFAENPFKNALAR